jgi:hypothetical protein
MRRSLVLLLILVCTGCKQPPEKTAAPAAGPQIRATVVTIRTTIQPDNKTYTHTLVIARGRARSTGELDQWRLFDTNAKSVTFVDDIAKTARTEPMQSLLKKRREALAAALPPYYPRARITRVKTGMVIEVGNYRRELELSGNRASPRGLFAMMHASDPASSPLAPIMRAADDALTSMELFPARDHSELPYGDKKLIVDRTVVSIVERSVPESMLTVPRGYKTTR